MRQSSFAKNRIFKVITLPLLTILICSQISFSQKFEKIKPGTFENYSPKVLKITEPEIESLLREDAEIENQGEFRFGVAIPLHLNFFQKAEFIANKYGRFYFLKIETQNALSLNFNFSKIKLSKGSRLWIYNDNVTLGAYGDFSISDPDNFATAPMSGNSAIIQFFEPYNQIEKSTIEIESIVYGYRYIKRHLRNFNNSGVCNVNINCAEGQNWRDEKRAVAMILTANNTRICTGTFINNARQDGTPYFLTANHCNVQSNSILMLNYESPTCENIDGVTNETMAGGQIVARSSFSDFLLFRTNDEIPVEFRPFFAGWTLDTLTLDSTVCIHHPKGDIKKITKDFDSAITGNYAGTPTPRHWRILDWEVGTTEGGSSGSALFNKNKKIIGQLHGGEASCSNNVNDYYGKFNLSWDSQPHDNQKLKPWLDPEGTGLTELSGFDPNPAPFEVDAELRNIAGIPNFVCNQIDNAIAIIRNNGAESILQLSFKLTINETISTFEWTGFLPYLSETVITLPKLSFNQRFNSFLLEITQVNGMTDENLENNSFSKSVEKPISDILTLRLKTDGFPLETSWKLILDNETIAAESNNYQLANFEYVEQICVPFGCYSFIIEDGFSDGICCEYGNGFYELTDSNGRILAHGGDFGSKETTNFCISNQENFSLYPNPVTNGNIQFLLAEKFLEEMLTVEIFDLNGKKVFSQIIAPKFESNVTISHLNSGVYVVRMSNQSATASQKFIIINQ